MARLRGVHADNCDHIVPDRDQPAEPVLPRSAQPGGVVLRAAGRARRRPATAGPTTCRWGRRRPAHCRTTSPRQPAAVLARHSRPVQRHARRAAGDTSCPDPIAGGDNWLSTWIPILTSGPDYTSGNLLIDVVWDEGRGGDDGRGLHRPRRPPTASCPTSSSRRTRRQSCRATNFSHYSLLKTTEELLGLPLLGMPADPSTNDMCGLRFGICPAARHAADRLVHLLVHRTVLHLRCQRLHRPGQLDHRLRLDFGDGGTDSGETPATPYAARQLPGHADRDQRPTARPSVTHQVDVSEQPRRRSGSSPRPG